jgi:SprT-like family
VPKKPNVTQTKLFKMVQQFDEFDCKFRPTIQDCRSLFRQINKQVFNNELKMPAFRLVYSSAFWGECTGDQYDQTKCTIKMNKSFLSKRLFVYTLAHEMVHQWEWLTNENMTHGPQFFIWREELSKFGIILSRKYRIKHYKLK